ncbi:uncharacterized protein [Gorilla gorilla gorilla]|uniref:uncharacterized protein isoform X5 n=1 Tax=Gorilla gorilla gorilla TaxID=9595 RepID=UPI002445A881|nr:uncharacterized protein LOC109025816 isoform X4 [Gorilla gorilla gorilla]
MFSGYLIALKCHSPVAHFKFPMILRKTLASILKTENKNSRPLKVEGEEKLYRLLRSGDLFKFHQPHFYELSGLTCTSTLLSFALGRSIPGSFPAHIFVESPFSKLQCVICEDCDLPGTSPQGIHFRLLLNGQVLKWNCQHAKDTPFSSHPTLHSLESMILQISFNCILRTLGILTHGNGACVRHK